MSSIISGINTGVIRHGNRFIALALQINLHKQQQLLLIPALPLRDLFICFEHRLHLQSHRSAKDNASFKQQMEAMTAEMHKHIPSLTQEDLMKADVRQRVEKIEPDTQHQHKLGLELTLKGGNTVTLRIADTQIALFVHAISLAFSHAGMHPLSLRLSSLLDFLPLYDASIQPHGELEYDTYPQPAWKLALFSETLALVYTCEDERGEKQVCGTVVKSRIRGDNKEVHAIAQRLLAFSPRLKKLKGKPCTVAVSTLASGMAHVPQEHCLRGLHLLWQKSSVAK